MWIAMGVVALGLFVLVQTAAIEVSPSYARVGPRVFPWVVSGVLVLLGLGLAVQAEMGRWRSAPEAPAPRAEWPALLWILAGPAAYALTIAWAGFPVASALLFAAVARGFGSRRPLLDGILGLVLGATVFVGFTYGLGLALPAGLGTGPL